MIKIYKPTSPGRRARRILKPDVAKKRPLRKLTKGLNKSVGRNNGRISTRHKQRGAKRLYREIDFLRDNAGISGVVASVEYDPNRGSNVALINYANGDKRYILAPEGLHVGMKVEAGDSVEPTVGNCMALSNIPLGMEIHNLEVNPGAGGILVRGAGNYAQITAKEEKYVNVKLPSGEIKKFHKDCRATIGSLSNAEKRNIKIGKAGINRLKGKRPSVRGVAMSDPKHDHPHAGSYSTSGIGMSSPKTPWGKKARGVKTRKRKNTNYTVVKSRHDAKKRK